MRPPHARPDPRYFPPEKPAPDDMSLAEMLVSAAALAVIFVTAFLFLGLAR